MITCKSHEKNIESAIEKVLEDLFAEGSESSYCCVFKTRNNNQVRRDDVIQLVTKLVRLRPGQSRVDLKNPDIAIIIDVIRTVVCVGVAYNYFQKKKYNLVELARTDNGEDDAEAGNNDEHDNDVSANGGVDNTGDDTKTVKDEHDNDVSANGGIDNTGDDTKTVKDDVDNDVGANSGVDNTGDYTKTVKEDVEDENNF